MRHNNLSSTEAIFDLILEGSGCGDVTTTLLSLEHSPPGADRAESHMRSLEGARIDQGPMSTTRSRGQYCTERMSTVFPFSPTGPRGGWVRLVDRLSIAGNKPKMRRRVAALKAPRSVSDCT